MYDPTLDVFGPGKFVGYRDLSLQRYDDIKEGWPTDRAHDGGATHATLRRVLGGEFYARQALDERLIAWGESLLGPRTFDGIDADKWRYLSMPGQPPPRLGPAGTAAVEAVRARGRGQGFNVSPAVRLAVEAYAMRVAIEYFQAQGYDVDDVSRVSPYDLRCRRAEETLHVEVKGTQGGGEEVLLTPNEVAFARAEHPHTAMFVVHSVQATEAQGSIQVSGGLAVLHQPWNPDEATLLPVGYACQFRTPGTFACKPS